MYRTLFIMKTWVVAILLLVIAWMAIISSRSSENSTAYIRAIDPYQSQADLQQTKNKLQDYLNIPLAQPIGLILRSDAPLFLIPPTYDTGTLWTYIQSIQSQEQGTPWDITSLVSLYSTDHIFISSDQSHNYNNIEDFAQIDISISVAQSDSSSSWKIGILSVLLIVVLLI